MPIVTLEPNQITLEVPFDTLLFDAACRAGLPVASSCSAEAVCGKCVMKVMQGAQNLSVPSDHEMKLLRRDSRGANERISCMARVQGDCSVTTGYW
ncbi:(2Fe-2S)-binding protein [bacterium]|nr:(2Fe-2S)-binding protein [bacterium]NBX81762.1 (2Fe-2S)-binding protein [bacterium]